MVAASGYRCSLYKHSSSLKRKFEMNLQRASLAVLFVCIVVGRAGAQPAPEDARRFLRSVIDGGKSEYLELTSFEKTDGQAVEVSGAKGYRLLFSAKVEVLAQPTSFSTGSPLPIANKLQVLRQSGQRGSLDGAFFSAQGYREANKGDILELSGGVHFERRESGWVPRRTEFSVTHRVLSVRAAHILLKFNDQNREQVRARAEQIAKLANTGGAFAELAAKFSEDPKTAKQGGDLGFLTRKQMNPSVADVAFWDKPGDPVVVTDSPQGWHIVKVLERRH